MEEADVIESFDEVLSGSQAHRAPSAFFLPIPG